MAEPNQKAIININNTSYNIQDDWMEIVRKYFNIDPDDDQSINFLKAGLFGYDAEVTSNEIKNNVFHRNIIYDEHFLNTASFPESIYNFAKTYNYTVDMARPSHVRINFAIRKEDLVNNKFKEEITSELGSVVNTRRTYQLTIKNDFVFLMDNIPFRLPYPVKVTFKETENKSDFSLVAMYEPGDDNFPFLRLTNYYVKLWQDFVNGEKVVFLGLDLYQLEKNTTEFDVVSEDITDNLFYDVKYDKQLSYFNVFYEYNGERKLLKNYFNNTFQPTTDEEFCYYSLIDDDKLQISFSSASNSFRPRLNSKLVVETFTTTGEKGNFSYLGNNINVNFNNNGEFDKVPVSIIPITECDGGMDRPSFTRVKNGLIERFAVRDNLIIDNDLEIFFRNINETENVHGSNIEFIKKRNDVIKRLFNAYLITRDKNRKVIPGNTAPTLKVSKSYLEKNSFCIKENTPIIYNPDKDEYLIESEAELSLIKNKKNILKYSSPFLLNVQKVPILMGNYFSTFTNENPIMKFKYVNPHIDENFSIREANVYKNNVNSTKYVVSFNMNSTYNSTESVDIKIRCVLTDMNGKPYGFLDLNNLNEGIFYYEGYLETDNLIIDNKLRLINSLYNVKGAAKSQDIIENVLVDSHIKMQIGILLRSSETNEKEGVFKEMTDLEEYTTALIYETEDHIEVFKNLYNYMESDVNPVIDKKKSVNEFHIKQFPLIEREYFKYSYSNFFEVWNVYLSIIKDNIDKLENNTSVDIKLTNTYGPSRFYYYDSKYNEEGEIEYDFLDNIHLNIEMVIHLNYYMSVEIDAAIKQFISDFLETCNDTRLVPISNLIRMLENEFEIIKYIEFFSIGDFDTQKIRTTFTSLLDMTKQEVEDYVPEYLNIEKKLDLKKAEENEDNNLIIDYPYNFNIKITYV